MNESTTTPPTDPAAALQKGLEQFDAVLKAVGGVVDGYRDECLKRGYSTATTEAMVLTVHDHLMDLTNTAAKEAMLKEMRK